MTSEAIEKRRERQLSSRPSAELSTKPVEERINAYLQSREVYRGARVVVRVDAFKFANAHLFNLTDDDGDGGHADSRSLRAIRFLSHFHSDHYAGLSKTWNSGIIYCSRATAALVCAELEVAAQYVVALEMNVDYYFSLFSGERVLLPASSTTGFAEDVLTVRLVDANHCPGAAMLVFEIHQKGQEPRVIIHTGDFRYNGTLRAWAEKVAQTPHPIYSNTHSTAHSAPFYEQFIGDHPTLRSIAGRVDTLFLDNTFCDTPFRFPTQWETGQHVVRAVRSLLLNEDITSQSSSSSGSSRSHCIEKGKDVHCAVLIGTYTIGKERVALAVQDAFRPSLPSLPLERNGNNNNNSGSAGAGTRLGDRIPIYVSQHKLKLLQEANYYADYFEIFPTCRVTSSSLSGEKEEERERIVVQGHEVILPMAMTGVDGNDTVRRALFAANSLQQQWAEEGNEEGTPVSQFDARRTSSSSTASPHTAAAESQPSRCLLSIFLVPMSAVSYPSLAAAEGVQLSRAQAKGGEEASAGPRLLSLGDDAPGLELTQFSKVLAVAPTGWMKAARAQRVSDRCGLLNLPYSEHSSFQELLQFVEMVNPRCVTPTVSLSQFTQHEALFVERAPRLGSKYANTQPITRFFTCTTHSQSSLPLSLPSSSRLGESTSCSSGADREKGEFVCAAAEHASSHVDANVATKAVNPFSNIPYSSASMRISMTSQSHTLMGNTPSIARNGEVANTMTSLQSGLPRFADQQLDTCSTIVSEATTYTKVDRKAVASTVMASGVTIPHNSNSNGTTSKQTSLSIWVNKAEVARTRRRVERESEDCDDDDDCMCIAVHHAVIEISDDESDGVGIDKPGQVWH